MKSYEDAILYDFYGNLLTQKMQTALEYYLNEDLSLAEIAQATNISRQGVYDTIRRALKLLHEYEEKLGLARRFADRTDRIDEAIRLLECGDNVTARNMLAALRDDMNKD